MDSLVSAPSPMQPPPLQGATSTQQPQPAAAAAAEGEKQLGLPVVATQAAATGVPKSSARTGRWTEKEKALFLQGFAKYSMASFRWKKVSEYVGTRTAVQCKTHHQKIVGGGKTKRSNTDLTNPALHPDHSLIHAPPPVPVALAPAPAQAPFAGIPDPDPNAIPGEGDTRMQSLLDVTTAEHPTTGAGAGLGAAAAAAAAADSAQAAAAAAAASAAIAGVGVGGMDFGIPGIDDSINTAVAQAEAPAGVPDVPGIPGIGADGGGAGGDGGEEEDHGPSPEVAAAVARLPDDNDEPVAPSFGRWTEQEKTKFDEAMRMYGRGRWKLVSKHVGTRTSTQCKTHHQKVQDRLKKQEQKKEEGGLPLPEPAGVLPPVAMVNDDGGIFAQPPPPAPAPAAGTEDALAVAKTLGGLKEDGTAAEEPAQEHADEHEHAEV